MDAINERSLQRVGAWITPFQKPARFALQRLNHPAGFSTVGRAVPVASEALILLSSAPLSPLATV